MWCCRKKHTGTDSHGVKRGSGCGKVEIDSCASSDTSHPYLHLSSFKDVAALFDYDLDHHSRYLSKCPEVAWRDMRHATVASRHQVGIAKVLTLIETVSVSLSLV